MRAPYRSSLLLVGILCVFSAAHCLGTETTVALRFEGDALTLPSAADNALNGPLTYAEADRIRRLARAELETAFAGLRIRIIDGDEGFWRVAVVQRLANQGPLPNAGMALPLGVLGGSAFVGFDVVALEAVRHAPPGAPRPVIIDGIARGIGRVAAHEVGHQIVGVQGRHNETDEESYEYHTPARAAQYYGQLHWTVWWPDLQRRVGQ